jgi:hypothetical protein
MAAAPEAVALVGYWQAPYRLLLMQHTQSLLAVEGPEALGQPHQQTALILQYLGQT